MMSKTEVFRLRDALLRQRVAIEQAAQLDEDLLRKPFETHLKYELLDRLAKIEDLGRILVLIAADTRERMTKDLLRKGSTK